MHIHAVIVLVGGSSIMIVGGSSLVIVHFNSVFESQSFKAGFSKSISSS